MPPIRQLQLQSDQRVDGHHYPCSRNVKYHYDSLGRIDTVDGVAASGTTHYASNINYASHGPTKAMTLGGILSETRTYSMDKIDYT